MNLKEELQKMTEQVRVANHLKREAEKAKWAKKYLSNLPKLLKAIAASGKNEYKLDMSLGYDREKIVEKWALEQDLNFYYSPCFQSKISW